MYRNIEIRAGERALSLIREGGFRADMVTAIAGASGGPKWLVLAGLDRVIPQLFRKRRKPLHLIGSSIGAWRLAGYSSPDTIRAIETFEDNYIHQQYSRRPTPSEVTAESIRILDAYVSEKTVRHILAHPFMRLCVIAVKSKGIGKSDSRFILPIGLGAAALANLLDRKLLRFFYERAIFYDTRVKPPLLATDEFTTKEIPLTPANLKHAIMASGSIPLVMSGIGSIPDAPEGTYRDGGIIDYHLDLPFTAGPDDIIFYPHFSERIIPGWFDKNLRWRKPRSEHVSNMLLIAPSRSFIDSLPLKKIPDRDDFNFFRGRDSERFACWEKVAGMSRIIAEEFMNALESGTIRKMVKPIDSK